VAEDTDELREDTDDETDAPPIPETTMSVT
jgi:hypothetical protein